MRWIALVGCTLLLILLLVTGCGSGQAALKTFRVNGQSMAPTLHVGEEVSVDTQAYASSQPARGDVILFHYPVDPTQEFIKRVIGIPGDIIQLTPTQVFLNGKLLNEPYISEPFNPSPMSITLQPNQYFVMGDNRPFSSDSRSWGPVPRSSIIGKVILPSSFHSSLAWSQTLSFA